MNFRRLKKKVKGFYNNFIVPPKRWRFPEKSEILIYDVAGAEELAPYLIGYRIEMVSLRGEFVNVPCLLLAVFKRTFWIGNPVEAYTDSYITAVSPVVVLTIVDNNPAFYTISTRFPNIKTIFLQNGTRAEHGDIFSFLRKSERYHVDYMLVHNYAIGLHYKNFLTGDVIVAGSLKNNKIEISNDHADGVIFFISQYHDKPEGDVPFFTDPDGAQVHWGHFFSAELQVLNFLSKWCVENNKLLQICGRTVDKSGTEKDFYFNCLRECGCNWEYLPRSGEYSSYALADGAEIVVFVDSTLGYELIARGKKTAGFSCRTTGSGPFFKFGWPAELPDNGPFWTNNADEKQFRRVMDYLNTISAEEWEQTRQLYASELMEIDIGNKKIRSLLKQLLSETENINYAK